MHVFFSGIGGAAIGPLALIARQAGYTVSGSDKQDSQYIHYLQAQGISDIHLGQDRQQIAAVHAREPIDWFVYTSALPMEQPDAQELAFCREQDIKNSKRDELLNRIIEDKQLKLIAIAGTHGKTTTTAMTIWLFKQLGLPISYSVGAKLSFGDMGQYEEGSEYFVYEADEFDRNFLNFRPHMAIIAGIDWDHPDIYPTRDSYNAAFREFLEQSDFATIWKDDAAMLELEDPATSIQPRYFILDKDDFSTAQHFTLPGSVNRQNAWLVANAMQKLTHKPLDELVAYLNRFPGVSRRFEQIAPGLYSDYAHTPSKIRGALQLAEEVAGGNVVVIYEGLHNTRQHFIRDELKRLFDDVKQLYIVPSYLARENQNLPLLTPTDLIQLLSPAAQARAEPAELNDDLAATIRRHLQAGDTVLCLTAGGGHSLDEWLRATFQPALGEAKAVPTIHKVAAVVIQDNRFLMVRQFGREVWTSLGGHLEPGETEVEALRRETQEELGCSGRVIRKLGDFRAQAATDDAKLLLSTYLMTLDSQPKVIDPVIEEIRFIGKDYATAGIKLPESIERYVLPYCIKHRLLDW